MIISIYKLGCIYQASEFKQMTKGRGKRKWEGGCWCGRNMNAFNFHDHFDNFNIQTWVHISN